MEVTQRRAGSGASAAASDAGASRASAKSGGSRAPNAKSAFFSQTLPAWTPILTPFWIYAIMLSTGALFIALGIALKLASDGVVELRVKYDGAGAEQPCAAPLQGGAPRACTLSLAVPAAMKAPVYVYYELTNFYQNHRRYVQSRSNEQLAAKGAGAQGLLTAAELEASACRPLKTTAGGKALHPCGLIANSLFNGAQGAGRWLLPPVYLALTTFSLATQSSLHAQTHFAPPASTAAWAVRLHKAVPRPPSLPTTLAGLRRTLRGPRTAARFSSRSLPPATRLPRPRRSSSTTRIPACTAAWARRERPSSVTR